MDKKYEQHSDPWVWISILGFFIALTIFSLNFFEMREKENQEVPKGSASATPAEKEEFSVVLVQ